MGHTKLLHEKDLLVIKIIVTCYYNSKIEFSVKVSVYLIRLVAGQDSSPDIALSLSEAF